MSEAPLLAEIDRLLGQIDRMRMQKVAVEGHLWFTEHLLTRIGTLLPRLSADNAPDSIARDVLVQEIAELLAEDRPHPGSA